jgi:hypothetical protein
MTNVDRTSSVARRRWGLVVAVLVGAAGGGCPAPTQCPGGSCDISVESTGIERIRGVGDLDNGGLNGGAAAIRSTGDAGAAVIGTQGTADPAQTRAQAAVSAGEDPAPLGRPQPIRPIQPKFRRAPPR